MSKKITQKELEATFDKALNDLNAMRGKVKAFILIAATDDPSNDKEKKKAFKGISSSGGEMGHLVTLYENIDDKIKLFSAIRGLSGILGNMFEDESNKK